MHASATAVAVALVLTGATVSACAHPVSGAPVVTNDAKARTVVMPAEAPPPSLAPQQYLDVHGDVADPPRDTEGFQFGTIALPGVSVAHRDADGVAIPCTLGPAVTTGSRHGFLTAGHCTAAHAATDQYLSATADVKTSPQILLGTTSNAVEDDGTAQDSAVIWTDVPLPRDAARIAGSFPVAGVMPEVAVQALPVGTPICLDGAKSGIQCGAVMATSDHGLLRFAAESAKGDSGAPVFVVGPDRRATLVGLLEGGDSISTTATYLAPTLARLDAVAVTAPA